MFMFFFVSFCLTLVFFIIVFITLITWPDNKGYVNSVFIIANLLAAVIVYCMWAEMYRGYVNPTCVAKAVGHV